MSAVSSASKRERLEALEELRQQTIADARADVRLLTVREACEALKCGRTTFYKRLKAGMFDPIMIDGRVYVAYDEIAEYLRGLAVQHKAKIDNALRAKAARRKAKTAA